MMADQEIIDMQSQNGFGGLGQLLAEAGTPAREVALDVLGDDNKDAYWSRSDNFDLAVDFRFTQPVPDALGRVIEAWIEQFFQNWDPGSGGEIHQGRAMVLAYRL